MSDDSRNPDALKVGDKFRVYTNFYEAFPAETVWTVIEVNAYYPLKFKCDNPKTSSQFWYWDPYVFELIVEPTKPKIENVDWLASIKEACGR